MATLYDAGGDASQALIFGPCFQHAACVWEVQVRVFTSVALLVSVMMSAAPVSAGSKDAKRSRVIGTVRFVNVGAGYASVYDPNQRIYSVRLKDLRHPSGSA